MFGVGLRLYYVNKFFFNCTEIRSVPYNISTYLIYRNRVIRNYCAIRNSLKLNFDFQCNKKLPRIKYLNCLIRLEFLFLIADGLTHRLKCNQTYAFRTQLFLKNVTTKSLTRIFWINIAHSNY